MSTVILFVDFASKMFITKRRDLGISFIFYFLCLFVCFS